MIEFDDFPTAMDMEAKAMAAKHSRRSKVVEYTLIVVAVVALLVLASMVSAEPPHAPPIDWRLSAKPACPCGATCRCEGDCPANCPKGEPTYAEQYAKAVKSGRPLVVIRDRDPLFVRVDSGSGFGPGVHVLLPVAGELFFQRRQLRVPPARSRDVIPFATPPVTLPQNVWRPFAQPQACPT